MESFYRNEYRNSLEDLYIENNYDNLSDEKALELLLLYSLTIQQASSVAKRLLEHFKTLSNVINADFDELIEIGGMDRDSAVLVSLVGNLESRAIIGKSKGVETINSSEAAAEYFKSIFAARKDKDACACLIDNEGKIVFELYIQLSASAVDECIKTMEEKGAQNLIIAYRAAGADLTPDDSVLGFVKELSDALTKKGMSLCDVISVFENKSLSFATDLRYILYLN